MHQVAGAVGVDPGPFTLAELVDMDNGRSKANWEGWSNLMAAIINVHLKKGHQIRPDSFNPWLNKKGRPIRAGSTSIPMTTDNLAAIKSAYEAMTQ